MRVFTERTYWLFVCALLAACSRPQPLRSCDIGAADKARHAEIVRLGLPRNPCTGAGEIAVLDHRAEVTLHWPRPTLTGHGDVRVRTLAATTVVQLDSAGLRISSASSRGEPLRLKQVGGSTCLELSRPLAAGDELTIALVWEADPRAQGSTLSADQAWAGSRTPLWLPTKLDPAQRATLSLTLTVPEDLSVVGSHSQAVFSTSLGDGLRRVRYEVTTPTSPSLYAFAVGQFRTASYYSPGFARFALSALGPQGADLEGVLELTVPMFQFLSERTGAKPATAYAQVFVHGEALQEALGLSLIPEDVLRELRTDPSYDDFIAHELVHQWFGVLVPCAELTDLWLSEGFATFMVAAIKEQPGGRAAYDRELERWRVNSRQVHACGGDAPVALSRPGAPRATGVTEEELRARGVVYYRGALVLDKLRRELSEQVFWDGIRRYVNEQAGKPTRTEDLQRIMAATSGRDLKGFFDRWVYAAAPDL
jgi:aminopeptidase N